MAKQSYGIDAIKTDMLEIRLFSFIFLQHNFLWLQHILHVSGSCLKWSLKVSVRTTFCLVVMFFWMPLMSQNHLQLRVVFIAGNRKKLGGVRSGERGGWLTSTTAEFTKKCVAVMAE
jgi:hypothetical protein